MFLAKISLDYSDAAKIRECKMDADIYHELRSRVPGLELPEDYTAENVKGYWPGDILVDEDEVQALTDAGLRVTIERLKGMQYPTDRFQSLTPQPGQNVTMVSVPNVGLLSVKKVTWLENACTEVLQQKLDEGWRILAVCPPNDQRRPDYILGRSDDVQ